MIVDVDSAGTPVEHYAHIMAVYADKMPPNPVLHDNGLALVQRISNASIRPDTIAFDPNRESLAVGFDGQRDG